MVAQEPPVAPGVRPLDVMVTTWKVKLKVGFTYKRYVINVKRTTQSCSMRHLEIFVNREKLDEFDAYCPKLTYSQWEQDGHHFQLTPNPYPLFSDTFKEMRLFIDGFDADTGTEFTFLWRKRSKNFLFIGIGLLILVLVVVSTFSYTAKRSEITLFIMSNLLMWVFIVAVILVLVGISLRFCKDQSRKPSPAKFAVDYREIMTI